MDSKDKTVITKEELIKFIVENCENDFVTKEKLISIISKASETDYISKKNLIRIIENTSNKAVVKDVYNTLENLIPQLLALANEEHDVSIRMFEGITLDAKFVPEQRKKNNLTGKIATVGSKIKPKFNITRPYCEKLNAKK